MQEADLKTGYLHRALGVPEDEKIPLYKIQEAAKKEGRLGRAARLALVFRRYTGKRK